MSDTHKAIEAVWRIESARLIAGLTRQVRDVGVAEELAQEALLTALEKWPRTGVPENPGAWLMAAGKLRALDHFRRDKRVERRQEALGRELKIRHESALAGYSSDNPEDEIGDDLLKLVFLSCHPVLSTEARVALTLRLLGGLTTAEIARAYVVPEPTIAQRIVRAKRTLTEARAPFEMPRGDDLKARLASVLEVIYLIFNEGYSATAGEDWMRPGLCEEALRLGRMVTALLPNEAEAHGLLALMDIQASRVHARTNADGDPILLLDQDRSRWDLGLIRHGLAELERAESAGGALGPYALQASIAACHARARAGEDTDWGRIAALYDALAQLKPSPIVDLNRSIALSMAFGPAAGLELIDQVAATGELRNYHLLPSVRGDFLFKLGRFAEAREDFLSGASLTQNARERELLLNRARQCGTGTPSPLLKNPHG